MVMFDHSTLQMNEAILACEGEPRLAFLAVIGESLPPRTGRTEGDVVYRSQRNEVPLVEFVLEHLLKLFGSGET